jgi:very-short-patch-repair endonuclease
LLLWNRIRNRQLGGVKFVRQEPIGRYYADFVCRERRIVVELDGGQHAESNSDRYRGADLGTGSSDFGKTTSSTISTACCNSCPPSF